jgi:D-tyrosyl-tRNA(Tyr) deacylase
MIAVVQRVTRASVVVGDETVGQIGPGLLVLVAVHKADTDADVAWTAGKLATLRVFRNADKHFDADVKQAGGSVLLVSNFTVAAATRRGRRPSFDAAAPPERGRELFDRLVEAVRAFGVPVATGRFGADMAVSLVNEGPVTVIVDSRAGGRTAEPE